MIYLITITIASLLANATLLVYYHKGLKIKEELLVKVKVLTDYAEDLSIKLVQEIDLGIDLLHEVAEKQEVKPAKRRGRRKKPNTNKAV